MAFSIFILLFAVAVTQVRFRRGVAAGLATGVFFLVVLPIEVRLPTPGALPELTVQRALLVVLATNAIRHGIFARGFATLPGLGILMLLAASRSISLLGGIAFVPGLKDLLLLLLEGLLFFTIAGKALQDRETALRIIRSIIFASICVAFIAFVEKYRGVNLAAAIVPGIPDYPRTVSATYRHRILLGYAMALALPLVLAYAQYVSTRWQKRLVWAGMLLIPAACYFANSRGPWAGMALGVGVIYLASERVVRKRIALLGCVALVVVLLRPGVYESILTRWEHTKSTDTHKGRSASYRLELWQVAYTELSKSPIRFLFGYGGGSAEQMQLGDLFEFGGGSSALGYTSWDSELAANLFKFGFVGLALELAFYAFVFKSGIRTWRYAPREGRHLLSGCLAVAAVYIWALTNVAIFNPQVSFIFLMCVAILLRAPYFLLENENQPPAAQRESLECTDRPVGKPSLQW